MTLLLACIPVKAITTGEGGMVTTEDDELAERCARFRTHGIGADAEPASRRGPWYYEVRDARVQLPDHRLPVRAWA